VKSVSKRPAKPAASKSSAAASGNGAPAPKSGRGASSREARHASAAAIVEPKGAAKGAANGSARKGAAAPSTAPGAAPVPTAGEERASVGRVLPADRLDALRMIRVRGAREHNLKDLSVDIPRDQLVVITGLSGSGKSSLAFDTIFAEGQRKYMESLSAYARQFLDQLKKPDVESIEGLPPTIAIEQRSSGSNPRSTVATSTEIYDYLRLLFARVGRPTCWAPVKEKKDGTVLERCGRPISASSPSQITDAVSRMPEGTRLMVIAPVVRAKKGFHKDVLDGLVKQGFIRARVNGKVVDLREALRGKETDDNPLKLGRYEKHTVEAVVDRISISSDAQERQRLAESVETALRIAEGVVVISVEHPSSGAAAAEWRDTTYSEKYACAEHPECALPELEPRLFSFNSPFGACPECDGLGTLMEFDEALVIPDESMSMREGAIAAWNKNGPVRAWFNRSLRRFCRDFKASFEAPVNALTADQRRILLHGTNINDGSLYKAKFQGVIPNVLEWWGSTENEGVKEWLSGFMSQTPCKTCCGDRLKIEALSVGVRTGATLPASVAEARVRHGLPTFSEPTGHLTLNLADFSRLNIAEAVRVVDALDLGEEHRQIAEPILKEVRARLGFLASVGLEYLSLDRKTATLSGGEAQRIRLATQVGSGLVGACYVLDEPTIGLHQRDNDRLIRTLRHLTDIGNTVIVVEHDEDMIRAADHLLDIGPGPGVHGGRVVAQGTVDQVTAHGSSLTADYLSGRKSIDVPAQRRTLSDKKVISVKGARQNNLKGVDATFPLGGVVCVTGVSGSGKSTLVNDILLLAAKKHLLGSRVKPGEHDRVTGLQHIDRIIEVDQSPIGRTPRSNPATYTGFFDDIRRVFAATKEAKIRGYEPGRFSFNVKGGRCEACQGQGTKKIEMHFLPDVFVECEVCKGTRYNKETLEVHYRGKSIAQVLDMTVEEACAFFENHPKILRFAKCLHDVGLDYVRLGQPSTQLSGGEAQRVKLATELGQSASGHTLYVLDEPTTGLHFEDIRKLLGVMHRLADAGHTLVVIEHNLDVIKQADWIVDLGPEGGDRGGTIVASGTPEQVAATPASHTGRYLKPLLKR
jgi:excinuclease ABC subunit A